MRRFMVKYGLILLGTAIIASCNDSADDTESESNGSEDQSKDSTEAVPDNKQEGNVNWEKARKQITGRWKIASKNGEDLTNNDQYKNIRHVFLKTGEWFISDEVDGDSLQYGITGGIWKVDLDSMYLVTIELPDSTINKSKLLELNPQEMILESTKSGAQFTWIKTQAKPAP